MMRFIGGGLMLDRDGTWQMVIALEDGNGPQQLEDQGTFGQDSFGESVDGSVVKVDYDFCPNGQSDIQFWFQR